jgi:hypothetical protein
MVSDFAGIVKRKVENIRTEVDVFMYPFRLVVCGSDNDAVSVWAIQSRRAGRFNE